jgi:hypothetical protein
MPGIGTILSLVLLDEIPAVNRFPRVQEFLSSCRLGKCAKASAGTRDGTAGAKIGKAHLKWAFSEAAVLFLRDHAAAQKYLARLEQKHGKGKALTILAQKLARAVYEMLKRQGAFAREQCFQRSGRGADEPGASLDRHGMNLPEALARAACTASLNAKVPRGHESLSPVPLLGPPLSLLVHAALVAHGLRVLLLTRAWLSRDNVEALSPTFDEDGMREQIHCEVAEHARVSALVAQASREPQDVCGAATFGCARAQKARQNPRPSADNARNPKAEKKQKIRPQDSFVS